LSLLGSRFSAGVSEAPKDQAIATAEDPEANHPDHLLSIIRFLI